MAGDFVLDASVVIAAYLPATPAQKKYSDNVIALLQNGAFALIPGMFPIEVGSVLIKARRRRLINAATLDAACVELQKLPCYMSHLSYTPGLLVERAKAYMLQGYDAVYFDLAKLAGMPLATLDRGQKSACGHHGVKLLTF